ATVELGGMKKRISKGSYTKDPFNCVTVPAVSRKLHVKLLKNMEKAETLSESSAYNFTAGKGEFGIICNGVSYVYVSDALKDLNLENKVKVLRIGFSNPMPKNLIKNFLKDCKKALIVEEGEPYMEEAVKAYAQEAGLTLSIRGKGEDLLSRLYEFDPAMIRKCIAKYFGADYTPPAATDLSDVRELPQRPPNLCAGCSHRATFYAVKKAAEGMETIYPTDIGCYTLGFLPPLSMGDFVICMGSSVGTSCGFSKVTDKKVISFIGDSTFFHSGIPGLVNAVFNNHNFTLVILDNGITAMTGHQPNPGVDMGNFNLSGYGRVMIEDVVKALGVSHITVIKPYRIKKSIEAVKEALNFKGVSVIISKEMCTLYSKSLKKPMGKPFYISDKCKNHRVCVNELACPAFFIKDNRVTIDSVMCAGCAVCAQICPENAILPIKDKK
ncbi:MAG: thiamine pyrophosphate-dependent enzyme, partial [Desulfobacterales bacterium]|nr:thiamine pyrophosphate-dependent enzyme [Desulfobacterales bacterium]